MELYVFFTEYLLGKMETKAQTAEQVPSWDGNPRGWRRYQREVTWYAMGCKPSVRKYIAPRLITKLTGPARLLAMGWSQQDFQGVEGLKLFIGKLAASPLVRRKLPNTAAVMNQYFQFRRHQNESISNFLVRESLHYEEFVEALLLLKDEKEGKQETFFFPEEDETEDEEESDTHQQGYRRVPTTEEGGSPSLSTKGKGKGSEAASQRSVGAASGAAPVAADSLDSFILEQLRGWRLLTAAALSPEEWRAVLASTNNKLDYNAVMASLEILYDEHFSRPRSSGFNGNQMFSVEENDEWDWSAWYDPWLAPANMWDDDESWWDEEAPGDPTTTSSTSTGNEEDAENMAMEGNRSWAQAQRATQAMKKDRGFGATTSKGSSEGCFICGNHGHLWKDCPDRYAPHARKGKGGFPGKGKQAYYMDHYEAYAMPFKGKKGKGKPKGSVFWMDDYWANAFHQKGHGKHKGGSKNYGNVNAYAAEGAYDYHGIEFDVSPLELQSAVPGGRQQKPSTGEQTGSQGMMDCGVTCSAGPEQSIKNLVNAILTKDRGAQITVDGKNRPRFRYGSGKWGRAQYHLQVKSSINQRTFQAYALPDPEEISQPWFDSSMLVPVLVGMDFLRSSGMIVDFSDGLAVFAGLEKSEPFHLPVNSKGHYMIDVATYLNDGKENLNENSVPSVNVIEPIPETSANTEATSNIHFHEYLSCPLELELGMTTSEETQATSGHEVQFKRQAFVKMWQRHGNLSPTQQDRLMGSLLSKDPTTSSSTRHAVQEGDPSGGLGLGARGIHRLEGSSSSTQPMAMHGSTRTHELAQQQVGSLAALRNLCSEASLCSQERSPGKFDGQPQSGFGQACYAGALRPAAQEHCPERGDGSRHLRQGHCGGAAFHPDGGAQEDVANQHGEDQQGKSSTEESRKVFEERGLRRFARRKQVSFKPELGSSDSKPGGPAELSHCRGKEKDDGAGGAKDAVTRSTYPSGKHAGRGGAGTGLQPSVREEPGEKKNLPLRIGKAMMNLIHHTQMDFKEKLAEIVYDQKPVVWEMFCSPHSNLTKACQDEGLHAVRIGLSTGYDLYKPETYVNLKTLFKRQRPRKFWMSPMCTYFCDWTDLNYWWRPEELQKKRRRERRMLRQLIGFLLWALEEDPTLEFVWEWPLRCRGWKEPVVMDFFEKIKKLLNQEVFYCRVDGCRYGLKDDDGNLLLKRWQLATNSHDFYGEMRLKTCVGNHQHAVIQGVTTNKSAYYPMGMCKAVARVWARRLLPDRWYKMLWRSSLTISAVESAGAFDGIEEDPSPTYAPTTPGEMEPDSLPELEPSSSRDQEPGDEEPTVEQRKIWQVKLDRFHRAAGHPTARNLARMLSDAQSEKWKIKMALDYKCPTCSELKPGGISSKQIPPAAVRVLPRPWEHLGIDVGEWEVPGQDLKVKFILFMDLATRYKVTETLFTYHHKEIKIENTDMVIKALSLRWLMDKPRPKVVIPDNAKSLSSKKFVDFLADLGIAMVPPPDHESWSHGMVEHGVGHVKETASRIQAALPDQDPTLSLALATSAINNTEFVKGYTSVQWVFGQQAELTEDELRQQLSLPVDRLQQEFLRLMNQRQHAEECARKAKATLAFSKLKNTSIRQPLRTYSLAQPVMIWRKFLPHSIHKGRRGGFRKTMRPRWVGPGKVVLHELIPGQDEQDNIQIVWVVLGNNIYRASVHSVRPLSAREEGLYEAQGDDSHKWKQLSDLIPKRQYTDITNEEPKEDDLELPDLPAAPGTETVNPRVRFGRKATMDPGGFPMAEDATSLPSPGVNDYVDDLERILSDEATGSGEPTTSLPSSISLRRSSTTSKTPLLDKGDIVDTNEVPENDIALPSKETLTDDEAIKEPEEKRARLEDDFVLDLNTAIEEIDYGYVMELSLDFSSSRQKKMFQHNPQAYLVKKMAGSEVVFRKLTESDKELFRRAKQSEVSSFIKSEAVRRCLSYEEQQKAQNSNRVLRARWVLTWKGVPEESREEALQDVRTNSETVHRPDGAQKAKARIVVLGFEHPDLVTQDFNTTAPVQSQLMKHLSLSMVAQRGWLLEGLDMKTAFLQTGKTEEEREIWTQGVPELRQALGASDEEVLRILKNVYGNSTAPRGLWKDVDETFCKLGAYRLLGDSSFWVWVRRNPNPRNENDEFETIELCRLFLLKRLVANLKSARASAELPRSQPQLPRMLPL